MRATRLPLWCYAAFLAAAAVWTLLGAPLSAEEWQDVPMRAWRLMVQWPARTRPVWRLWLMR